MRYIYSVSYLNYLKNSCSRASLQLILSIGSKYSIFLNKSLNR